MEATINEFKTGTYLYDTMIDHITEVAENPMKVKEIINQIIRISDKNADVLQTNIVGYPLLVNENDQKSILNILGYTKSELYDICNNCVRLTGIGKILDQFAFALPLLLLSGALHKNKKEDAAKTIFLFTFYRPYSSKIAAFFTLGTVDEVAMNYTTNVELNDKSYIHKYGTVNNVLIESAKTAYSAFIDILSGNPSKPTDTMIFNNIFYSAIFSKTGSWIKSLYGTYKKVKASGKSLGYETSFYKSEDSDTQEDSYEDNNIASDSMVKRSYVSKAVGKFNISPVDSILISVAARYGFNGNSSKLYEEYLIQAVQKISETRNSQIPQLFDAIVGSYLDTRDDATGIKHSSSEISTVKFLAYCKKNIKTSHTINSNIREMKNIMEDLLLNCSDKYVSSKSASQAAQMKLALFMYFVYFIQKA